MQYWTEIEIKKDAVAEDGTFEGYGAIFDVVDRGGDVIVPGAFEKTLAARRPKLLREHIPSRLVGTISAAVEDSRGLHVKGRLNSQVADGRETLALMRDGALDAMSIGFQTVKASNRGGARFLEEIDLWEVSIVTFAMQDGALVTDVKSLLEGNGAKLKRLIETTLRARDAGITAKEAKAVASAGAERLFEMREASDPAVMAAKSMADLRNLITGDSHA